MKKYLFTSLGISLVLVAVYFWNGFGLIELHSHFPYMVLFFFLQSLLISWLLSLAEKDRPRLPLYAIGAVSLRFLTAIFYLLILILLKVEDLRPLIIQFMVVYLLYMVFELSIVLANLRPNSQGNKEK
ncbi:MAG: hypothetical protein R8G66_28290 [Cytophagales bacterium]|nr:hypothetical protein [Cytophagales bacterium]